MDCTLNILQIMKGKIKLKLQVKATVSNIFFGGEKNMYIHESNNVFYDTETTNLSFLQVASDLKKLGIKNNMFFLRLYDRG